MNARPALLWLLFGVVGCSSPAPEEPGVDPVIGRWVDDRGSTIEFKENGELVMEQNGKTGTGTWERLGDICMLNVDGRSVGSALLREGRLVFTNQFRRNFTLDRMK